MPAVLCPPLEPYIGRISLACQGIVHGLGLCANRWAENMTNTKFSLTRDTLPNNEGPMTCASDEGLRWTKKSRSEYTSKSVRKTGTLSFQIEIPLFCAAIYFWHEQLTCYEDLNKNMLGCEHSTGMWAGCHDKLVSSCAPHLPIILGSHQQLLSFENAPPCFHSKNWTSGFGENCPLPK